MKTRKLNNDQVIGADRILNILGLPVSRECIRQILNGYTYKELNPNNLGKEN